jgi:hypothetical protein
MTDDDLLAAVLEIEGHVASDGWDQPTLLFALVPTEQVRRDQPALAAQLGVEASGPAVTTFEQPLPPVDEELGTFLAGISWPSEIAGAAVVVERIVLPPDAEADLADRPDAASRAREHPQAQDMRIVVGVSRDGGRMCALRLRGADDESVLTGADLVPSLADALFATFSG